MHNAKNWARVASCLQLQLHIHLPAQRTFTHTHTHRWISWSIGTIKKTLRFVASDEKMIWLPECRVSNQLKQPNSAREPPHLIHIKTKGYRQCCLLPHPPPHSFLIRGSLLRASCRLAALFVQFVVRVCHFVLPQWTQTLRPEGKSIRNTCS